MKKFDETEYSREQKAKRNRLILKACLVSGSLGIGLWSCVIGLMGG